jgi:putative two-component system response regulator
MHDKKPTILVIDDESGVRQSLRFILSDQFHVLTAPGALEGLFHMSSDSVDIVLMDIRLKGMDGLTVLNDIKQKYPLIEVIMITAYATMDTVRKAIRFGANDYLTKPFDKSELLSALRRALIQRRRNLRVSSELDRLREATYYLENISRQAQEVMIESCEKIMGAMLLNIDSKDGYTWSHAKRVMSVSLLIAGRLGLQAEQLRWLECSALIHDVGKINVDEKILGKSSKLTDYEYEIIKNHPEEGEKIIRSIPYLEEAVPSIKCHHERYDGSGYPDGIEGKQIPFKARILAVADAVDSMMNSPFKQKKYSVEQTERELKRHSGSQFDPEIVEAVIKNRLLFLT